MNWGNVTDGSGNNFWRTFGWIIAYFCPELLNFSVRQIGKLFVSAPIRGRVGSESEMSLMLHGQVAVTSAHVELHPAEGLHHERSRAFPFHV